MQKASAKKTVSARKYIFYISSFVVVLSVVVFYGQARTVDQTPVATDSPVEIQPFNKQQVLINETPFAVELAVTEAQRRAGLGGREGLEPDEGMLFVFDQSGKHCFWMKDVSFPIDILWFDESLKLVHVVASASPSSYPETFCPPVAAKYVVELQEGLSSSIPTEAMLEL